MLREYIRAVPVTRPYFNAKPGDPLDRFVEEAPEHPVFRLVRQP